VRSGAAFQKQKHTETASPKYSVLSVDNTLLAQMDDTSISFTLYSSKQSNALDAPPSCSPAICLK